MMSNQIALRPSPAILDKVDKAAAMSRRLGFRVTSSDIRRVLDKCPRGPGGEKPPVANHR